MLRAKNSPGNRRYRLLAVFAVLPLLAATSYCVSLLAKKSNRSALAQSPNNTVTITAPERIGRPVRLKIPAIKVDAAVEYVGLTPDGAIGVPQDFANVAWYESETRPGESGNAVIVGHYGRRNGKGSVFDQLHKLRAGDEVSVEDDRDIVTTFIVRTSRRYNPKTNTADLFSTTDEKSHLNLITCEGIWDATTSSFSARLVVFTDKK